MFLSNFIRLTVHRALFGNALTGLAFIASTLAVSAGSMPQGDPAPGFGKAGDPVAAALGHSSGYIAIYHDNDLWAGTDQAYTTGSRVAWISASRFVKPEWGVYGWLESISDFTRVRGKSEEWVYNYGASLTQFTWTPVDITLPAPIPNDRPYAGWLGVGLSLHVKNDAELHTLELSLGMIGPASLSENTQDFIHHLREIPVARGWDNQLKNEPTLNLHYRRAQRLWRESPGGSFIDSDGFWLWGVDLGNAWTNAQAGVWMRLGYNLPETFSHLKNSNTSYTQNLFTEESRARGNWSAYGTFGVEGRAIARDITLDGNTFTDSQSVDKRNFVTEITAALALEYKDCRLSYAHSYRSKEYHGQINGQFFGTVSLSFPF